MKQAHGTTPWYDQCGELHALDEHDRLTKRVYYAQKTPVHGDDNFILTGMNTILDLDIDIKHHMRTSIMPGIKRLRRGSNPKRPHKKRRTKSDQKPDIEKEKSLLFSEAAYDGENQKQISPE
jgi:hypothetical protein